MSRREQDESVPGEVLFYILGRGPRVPQTHNLWNSRNQVRLSRMNLRRFGQSPHPGPPRVVGRFDMVAIQEVRSKDQSVLPQFVEMVNADGAQ